MLPAILHQESFKIRFFEAEPSGRATPGALCRFAQEAADGHCRPFGFSLLELRAQNKMWVLTRLSLRVERYPQIGDMVTVETWASVRTNGIRAVREFRFIDEHGETLGNALSIWLMLDAATKRPVRLPDSVLSICNAERSSTEEFEFPRLRAPQGATVERMFQVGWTDLDANDHVNNVKYLEWALEALPLEVNRDRRLARVDIEFHAEAFYGDRIFSEVEYGSSLAIHRLKNGAGKTLCLAHTQFADATHL